MLSTKSSRVGVIGDLYLINWTEPLVWNGFISAPQTFSRPTFVVKLDDVRLFGLLLSKTLDGCGNFPFKYWKWGRPYPDIIITEMTCWNQSAYKVENIFRFRNSEICQCPCVTQPWQATWKRFYNFSETFITSKLFNLLLHILITSKLITII